MFISGSLNATSSGLSSTASLNATSSASASANASSSVIISFPSSASSSSSFSFSSLSTITSSSASFSKFTATPSFESQFSYVTESTLILASPTSTFSSSSVSSQTNPDQPTSTFSFASQSVSATASPTAAPLPTWLPTTIVPPTQLDIAEIPNNYTAVNILFQNTLNWALVANNTESSGQIFEWMPTLVASSLGISTLDVMQYALQVYQPDTYTGPDDASQLLTLWVAYVPTNQVSSLAQQLKDKNSQFYTGFNPPYSTLAAQVDAAFSVNSGSAPPAGGSGGGGSSNNGGSSGSSASKTREDAIIGVVTSLGAITLIILAFLVARAVKQRRALAHQRLAEPIDPGYDGARPDGQEFDRDSLGGQRRRSFYYAADSLRGFSEMSNAAAATYESSAGPDGGMRERRTVAPGMISTPVLRDNTMNW
ncbi:hypothetical protein IEO21_07359 [Rhodonia placenta]|uniref:Mid2 domain-containing protein n=1 Tax=Rhodonia placenta TaxID=104341 RepID=A0A8H7NYH1_9APHY|nr:hypothetical protein IEO21_07359 [Postia placenta]